MELGKEKKSTKDDAHQQNYGRCTSLTCFSVSLASSSNSSCVSLLTAETFFREAISAIIFFRYSSSFFRRSEAADFNEVVALNYRKEKGNKYQNTSKSIVPK